MRASGRSHLSGKAGKGTPLLPLGLSGNDALLLPLSGEERLFSRSFVCPPDCAAAGDGRVLPTAIERGGVEPVQSGREAGGCAAARHAAACSADNCALAAGAWARGVRDAAVRLPDGGGEAPCPPSGGGEALGALRAFAARAWHLKSGLPCAIGPARLVATRAPAAGDGSACLCLCVGVLQNRWCGRIGRERRPNGVYLHACLFKSTATAQIALGAMHGADLDGAAGGTNDGTAGAGANATDGDEGRTACGSPAAAPTGAAGGAATGGRCGNKGSSPIGEGGATLAASSVGEPMTPYGAARAANIERNRRAHIALDLCPPPPQDDAQPRGGKPRAADARDGACELRCSKRRMSEPHKCSPSGGALVDGAAASSDDSGGSVDGSETDDGSDGDNGSKAAALRRGTHSSKGGDVTGCSGRRAAAAGGGESSLGSGSNGTLICLPSDTPGLVRACVRAHERTHKGARPFACTHEGCGKAFTKQWKLTRHERTSARTRARA
ncbi:hypothetical protein KFE25_012395 [Diacronema lutheri]|uniref:C2H2-type domain-containing protein n=1 Tax=Diacronema lutheri TaxID=2081491 RepID=A0A8J5XN99_DIALT|nr:hypothetical protein KFE25_012395 [Diacronema lutheri]